MGERERRVTWITAAVRHAGSSIGGTESDVVAFCSLPPPEASDAHFQIRGTGRIHERHYVG